MFPVNLLIITLFKKARPRHKRSNRIKEALEEGDKRRKDKDTDSSSNDRRYLIDDISQSTHSLDSPHSAGFSRPISTVSDGRLSRVSALDGSSAPALDGSSAPTLDGSSVKIIDGSSVKIVDSSSVPVDKDTKQKKKKNKSWPWWVMVIGWILLWLTVLTSAAFVTFYGIMFQDVKCKKWITSMLISFFASVLFTQPVKVSHIQFPSLILVSLFVMVIKMTNALLSLLAVKKEVDKT